MRFPRRPRASAALAVLALASPCYQSLKYGGAIYVDADTTVAESEVGAAAGVTDPNPVVCGIPDRLTVYQHRGHNATQEVVYREPDGRLELFRSAGDTGFPLQGLVRWLVLGLVVVILLFAALPAILGHMRQPPLGGGPGDEPGP